MTSYPRDYTVGEVTKYINVKELGTTVDTTGYGKNTNGDVFLREELVTVTVTDIDTAGFVLTPSAWVRYQKMVASFPTQLSSILSPIPT